MKKILALLSLITFNTYSQENINESELTKFLNTNADGSEIKTDKEFMNI